MDCRVKYAHADPARIRWGEAAVNDETGFAAIRRYALSLPEVTEEPHFKLSSFRVRGRIFATLPADESNINIFVGEADRDRALALDPDACEKLWWGASVMGLKVDCARADTALVKELLRLSWLRKALRQLHSMVAMH